MARLPHKRGAGLVTEAELATPLPQSVIASLSSDLAAKIPASEKAAANGVATLDASGNVVQPSASAGGIRAVKATTQTVNNSATLVDDDALQFLGIANSTYLITLSLVYNSSTTADIKVRISGAGGHVTWVNLGAGATGATVAPEFGHVSLGADRVLGGVGGDRAALAFIRAAVGASDSTIKVQWAQNTAEASDTKMIAGSWLEAAKV